MTCSTPKGLLQTGHPQWQVNGGSTGTSKLLIVERPALCNDYAETDLNYPERSYYGQCLALYDTLEKQFFNTKTPFYNWSSYYAMAVIELAVAVAQEMKRKP